MEELKRLIEEVGSINSQIKQLQKEATTKITPIADKLRQRLIDEINELHCFEKDSLSGLLFAPLSAASAEDFEFARACRKICTDKYVVYAEIQVCCDISVIPPLPYIAFVEKAAFNDAGRCQKYYMQSDGTFRKRRGFKQVVFNVDEVVQSIVQELKKFQPYIERRGK
ncbi:MAG: hypothetical protein IJK26_09520 [Clostridia bacterium]|nr:hypothetical protein [Clostridia bacterium]